MGNLDSVARTFRLINIDADPDAGNFTTAEITRLKLGGQNRVISYLNLGSCENYRSYWSSAPSGLVSCGANVAAQRGSYQGYPDETWMDVGNADYQALILQHVAPRLVARGVDGFFFDNFEIVEHDASTSNGPCDSSCRAGGLDLIRRLRLQYPELLFVMQNATSDVTRLGVTGGVTFPSLLDGISHEEVYAPAFDPQSEAELVAWSGMALTPGGRPFFVGTEDYVGSCGATAAAQAAYTASRAKGFSPYASNASGSQIVVCFWPF
jgi:cysteinyl-tRNA synthetase